MSIQRVALVALTSLLGVASTWAAPRRMHKVADAPQYPLRVHIYTENAVKGARHGYHVSAWTGQANLMQGDDTRGLAYRSTCKALSPISDEDQEFTARWIVRGQRLELAMGEDASSKTCSLSVTLLKTVFSGDNGKLTSVAYTGSATGNAGGSKAGRGKAAKVKPVPAPKPADLNPMHYPLQVAVLSMKLKDTAPMATITPAGAPPATATAAAIAPPAPRPGLGRGNIKTEHGLEAVDFTTSCTSSIEESRPGEYYQARWRDEGKWMQILLVTPGSGPVGVCDLTTTLREEVYVRQADGTPVAMSQEAYKKLLREEATVLSRY